MKKLLILLLVAQTIFAQEMPQILLLKDRAIVQDQLLEERFKTVLPSLMRKQGIDMWLIIAREYNEDPIIKTMLPSTWLNARRRTILLIYDKGEKDGLECLAVARYNVGSIFKSAWKPEEEPNQWKRLSALIEERNPKKIALDISEQYAHSDGLSHSEYVVLMKNISPKMQEKVISSEKLSVGWLETRTPREIALYETLNRITHQIINEAFSEKVITPSITTTEDVVWYLRERVADLKLDTWFHPTVDVQRTDTKLYGFDNKPEQQVILPGDLLHCDFGITYLRLNTDVQELAYVLRPEDTDTPDYLTKAFAAGNHLQDIMTGFFKVGITGNQILALSLRKAEQDGVVAQIYSHPVGYHGHAAGAAIGMWDMQGGVPGNGEYPLNENTAYAIELNAKVKIPAWDNKEIRIMLEEQGLFINNKIHYIDGRQKQILTIPRREKIGYLGE